MRLPHPRLQAHGPLGYPRRLDAGGDVWPLRRHRQRRPALQRGFTLVELLAALAALALMAALAWQGVDAMVRSEQRTRSYSEDVLVLQTGLAQWQRDLDLVSQQPPVGGLDFDGRVLRLTRLVPGDTAGQPLAQARPTDAGGLRVVAWSSRDVDGRRQLLRWQSELLQTRAALRQAWDDAAAWGQSPSAALRTREVAVAAIDDWQIFYFRNNSWSSPLSSAGASPGGQGALPDGVRLVLTLAPGQAVSGRLTVDWVRPTLGAASP